MKWLACFLATLIISLLSCNKSESKTEEIPASVQSQMNVEACSTCPYYIQAVTYDFQRYYQVGPRASAPGIICDWFTGFVFYDSRGEMVANNSELYKALIAHGKKGKIIFDCQ